MAGAAKGSEKRIGQLCERVVEYMEDAGDAVYDLPIGELLVTWTQVPTPDGATQELLPFVDSVALGLPGADDAGVQGAMSTGAAAAESGSTAAALQVYGDGGYADDGVDLQLDYRSGKDKVREGVVGLGSLYLNWNFLHWAGCCLVRKSNPKLVSKVNIYIYIWAAAETNTR